MTAIVRYEFARSMGIDSNNTVVSTDRWVVVLGEYADEGEPAVLIDVNWAVDPKGNDIREGIARRIAAMLDEDVAVPVSDSPLLDRIAADWAAAAVDGGAS